MAESSLPRFSPCHTYSALLDRNAVASSQYHAATSQLVSLAGQDKAGAFAEAKRNCDTRLDECKRTTAAVRAHKAAHGC